MTAPAKPPAKPPREGVSNPHKNESGSDAAVRKVGRAFIITFYGALRAIKLYPVENAAVQKSLDDLTQSSRMLLHQEKELEFRASGEFIFINQTRLRLDVDNYTSFSNLLSLFRANGVGSLRVAEGVTAREWLVLLSLLQAPGNEGPEERYFQLAGKLEQAKVLSFEFGPPVDAGLDAQVKEQVKEAAKRTYRQSVAVTKECINSVRLGKAPNVKKLKRIVQGIVDAILNDETSLFGLTTIRDYDEYTFTHSVNVCIFSVALGRRLGLGKLQLYDLGLAALFHDIGKARVPVDVLNKAEGLSEEEWRLITNHPWLGVLSLFRMRGSQDLPYRSMVVAYEHHMKTDLSGYPKVVRPRSNVHLQQDRGGRRRVRRRDLATRVSDRPLVARGRPAGDAGQSEAWHGPGRRQSLYQPARVVPGGHAGRPRYLRAGDRPLGESQPRSDVAPDRACRQRPAGQYSAPGYARGHGRAERQWRLRSDDHQNCRPGSIWHPDR